MTFTLYKNSAPVHSFQEGIFSGSAQAMAVLWAARKDNPDSEWEVKIDNKYIIK